MKQSLKKFLIIILGIFSYAFGQNVGIGVSNPTNLLQVGATPGFSGNHFAVGNGTQAMSFYQSTASSTWFSNTNFSLMPNTGNGYVGINTQTPTTQLEVLTGDAIYGFIHTNGTVRVGTYIGSGGGWIGTQSNHPLYLFTNNSNAQVALTTSGYLGIGTIAPTNKLQVGSYINAGYGGNQFALGSGGTNVTVMNQYPSYLNFQSSTAMQIQSSSDIYLLPHNGTGNVGINTTSPIAPLEVDGTSGTGPYGPYALLQAYDSGGPQYVINPVDGSLQLVSIYAEGYIVAGRAIVAASDARIKNIISQSNNEEDLATINKIMITNYTMKDKVKNGNKPFKKVIAQEVEKVYPQVVNKTSNYIPNVYQSPSKIEKLTDGYLLTFNTPHNISKEAKKLQVIQIEGNMRYDIVSLPSPTQVIINAKDIKENKIFVYGELVNDFRTVDYDGLTTLNISATQQLSKTIKGQQEEIETLKSEVEDLKKLVKELKQTPVAFTK